MDHVVFETIHLHPWILTCPLKRDYFNRECIFQPFIFRGHVSFPGSISPYFCWEATKTKKNWSAPLKRNQKKTPKTNLQQIQKKKQGRAPSISKSNSKVCELQTSSLEELLFTELPWVLSLDCFMTHWGDTHTRQIDDKKRCGPFASW